MKVLFVTNLPSPYRVDFFNELGKMCELTVCYERHTATDRDERWKGVSPENFKEIFARVKPIGTDQSIGLGIVNVIKKEKFDRIIIAGYASPSVMLAIFYCKFKKIPYCIESDGAFYKEEKGIKRLFKRSLLNGAEIQFTTCEEHIRYFTQLGIPREKIFKYPFTSLKNGDISEKVPTYEEKRILRQNLGMPEEKIILSVGRFIHCKGYDVLLNSVLNLPNNFGIYIVGGKPTEEYLNFKTENNLTNVHFVDFKKKDELAEYYRASDVFVFPTREDIWGLVVNEAMAKGLPVISTNRCNSGLELIEDGKEGYIVPAENADELSDKIMLIFNDDEKLFQMQQNALEKVKNYTVANMASEHIRALNMK